MFISGSMCTPCTVNSGNLPLGKFITFCVSYIFNFKIIKINQVCFRKAQVLKDVFILTVSLCSDSTATGQQVLLDAYSAADSPSTTCYCSAIVKSAAQNSLIIAPHLSLNPSILDCGTRFDISVQSETITEEVTRECDFTQYNPVLGLQTIVNITYTKQAADGVDNSYCLQQ